MIVRFLFLLLLLLSCFSLPAAAVAAASEKDDVHETSAIATFSKVCTIPGDAPVVRVVAEGGESGGFWAESGGEHWTIVSSNSNGTYSSTSSNNISNNSNNGTNLPSDENDNSSAATTRTTYRYWVRECPCAPGIFCDVAFDRCGIPAGNEDHPSETTSGDSQNDQQASLSYTAATTTNSSNVAAADGYCYTKSQRKTVLRNVWPLILLWYATLAFFLVCTDKGRHARQYMLWKYKMYGCYWYSNRNRNRNEQLQQEEEEEEARVDRLWVLHGFTTDTSGSGGGSGSDSNSDNRSNQNEISNDNDNIRFGEAPVEVEDPTIRPPRNLLPTARPVSLEHEQEEQQPQQSEQQQPMELVLKTRIYHAPQHHQNSTNDNDTVDNTQTRRQQEPDETSTPVANTTATTTTTTITATDRAAAAAEAEEEETCTICFSPLQEGDRIGNLAFCHHIFHVACLKEWLPRRNVCPLCQEGNAATPRYGNSNGNDQGEDSSQQQQQVQGVPQQQQHPVAATVDVSWYLTEATATITDPRRRSFQQRNNNHSAHGFPAVFHWW